MPDDLFGDRVPRAARKKTARRAGEADLRTVSQRITDVARFDDLFGPSRHQWQHAQRTLLIPRLEELSETFADLALAQALRQGLLPTDAKRSWSSPQRHQLIAGDGTVAKSPTLSTTPFSVDPTTGEARRHRVDPASSWQKEGGADRNGNNATPAGTAADTDTHAHTGEGAMVLGTKFVVFSTRHRGYFRRVFLRYAHVPHNQPGAFLDDGTSTFVPLSVGKLERRASTHTHRWYHLLDIPCPHQHRESVGVTSTIGELSQGQSDTETGFHRAENLLQIPDNTAVHQTLYGGREDTDAGSSPLDRALWNRRMIAFGAEAQSLVILGFLLAQNATSAVRHHPNLLRRPHRDSRPQQRPTSSLTIMN